MQKRGSDVRKEVGSGLVGGNKREHCDLKNFEPAQALRDLQIFR